MFFCCKPSNVKGVIFRHIVRPRLSRTRDWSCWTFRSAVEGAWNVAPLDTLVRGHLEDVRPFVPGDYYSWRGAKQRRFATSLYSNGDQVSEFGRDVAIKRFGTKLNSNPFLKSALWCHGDEMIFKKAFKEPFPAAFTISMEPETRRQTMPFAASVIDVLRSTSFRPPPSVLFRDVQV